MNIYDCVKEILTNYPATRDSDKKLIWSVWIKEGKVIGGKISLDNFMSASVEESITRARRKVQEECEELRATLIVEEMRKAKEEEKGTFVFHEKVDVSEPLTIPLESMSGLLKYRKVLEDKGVLRPKK